MLLRLIEIWACPLRGRHLTGFASLGASHASPLQAAHANPQLPRQNTTKQPPFGGVREVRPPGLKRFFASVAPPLFPSQPSLSSHKDTSFPQIFSNYFFARVTYLRLFMYKDKKLDEFGRAPTGAPPYGVRLRRPSIHLTQKPSHNGTVHTCYRREAALKVCNIIFYQLFTYCKNKNLKKI